MKINTIWAILQCGSVDSHHPLGIGRKHSAVWTSSVEDHDRIQYPD